MIRVLLLCLLFGTFLKADANPFSFNILGYAFIDSNKIDLEKTYQKILTSSSYLGIKKDDIKGVPKLRKPENKTGVFFISMLLLYIFAGVRLLFSHQFAGSLNVIKNIRNQKKGQSETDRISLLSFYALYLITLGYAGYNFLTTYKGLLVGLPVAAGAILCITFVAILYITKTLLMWLVAWCFGKNQVLSQYFVSVAIIYKVSAIVLFPLSILILISSSPLAAVILKLIFSIFLLAVLMRFIVNIGLMKKLLAMHLFHFILYLCAFEIIPMLLLVKWLK